MNENTCSDIPGFRTQIQRWFRSDCCAASIGGLKQWQSELNNIYGHSIPDCNEISRNNEKDIDILFINASGNSIRKDHQQIKNAAAAEQVLKDDGLLVCIIDSEEVFEAWQNIYERFGFSLINRFPIQTNNPDFSNLFLIFIRTEKREAAQRSVKAIIEDDNKKTTYKLPLLRAVCDLSVSMPTAVSFPTHMENLRIERKLLENRKRDALSEEKRGRRSKNALRSYEITIPENIQNRISIPFGLVLERILEYYWHIFKVDILENQDFPAQAHPEIKLAFRKKLQALIKAYKGDFESFRNEWYSGCFASTNNSEKLKKARCITSAFKKISDTIQNGPIKYSGNSQENPSKLKHWLIFSVLQGDKQKLYSTPEEMIKSEGSLFMPAGLWFEISNSSTWLKDSIIVEWAQLSEFFSRNSNNKKCKEYTTAGIIPLLLPHENKRNTDIARLEFEKAIHSTGLRCVWTGRALSETDLHVDHLLPWSRLHCNALWNLFPAYRLVNIRKSDKVPSLDCLEKNSNRIFSIWSMLEESNSAIFRREAETTLTGSPLPAVKWQTPLFDRLIETTESLALQSGAQRWDP